GKSGGSPTELTEIDILLVLKRWACRAIDPPPNSFQITKTELQSALAEATQTDKNTAGVFLDTLSALAYKEIKRNGEFVLPGFGKLVKQKRKARTGFNPKTQTEDQDSSKDRSQISCCQGYKGRGFGGKEVV